MSNQLMLRKLLFGVESSFITYERIIGLHFFEDDNGLTVTVIVTGP